MTSTTDALKEFGEAAANAVLERMGRGMGRVQERKPLPYDLLEDDDAYLVVFDAPGATRSDIQVRFNDGEVQVRIDRFRDFYEDFEMRFPGRGLALDGQVRLAEDALVDASSATATLTSNGTLRVHIPKEAGAGTVEITEDERETAVESERDTAVEEESGAAAEGDEEDPRGEGLDDIDA